MPLFAFTPFRRHSAAAAPEPDNKLEKSAQNLLSHIPGEASGLYLMGVEAVPQPPKTGTLVLLFILAFTLLLVVRWVGNATRGVLLTSVGAFLIWMLVLDRGLLHVLFPNFLPGALGLVVAVFYSAVITALANAGKIK